MSCSISIGNDEVDGCNEFAAVEHVRRSRKARRCGECRCVLAVGEPYVRRSGKFDGDMFTEIYCPACFDIHEHFTEGGYVYGQMWQEMYEHGFEQFTTACLDGLSIPAKTKLLAKWRKWKGLDV